MAKINVLTSDVYNLISAGEVVVNPAGVVKELVENSIDAGATKIMIDIVQGGISKIKVVDNGGGIESEDVENAFKQHATSKICTKEDIYKISTLGFRGEALASIALVSNVQMLTKTEQQDIGTFIELQGGEVVRKEVAPCNTGTSITVSKLFYNTPARFKFLKTPLLEQREIYKLVSIFILSHPEIEFTLVADGNVKLNNQKGDLQTGILTVYGEEFADNLIIINEKFEDFRLEGAISLPYIAKPNHSWQTTFVNNRSVENDVIGSAVNGAYVDFLMKGKYPCFVLNLSLPYDEVDVNISPQKTVVKFNDSDKLYRWIYVTIKDKLADMSKVEEDQDRLSEKEENFSIKNPLNYIKTSFLKEDSDRLEEKKDGVSIGYMFSDNSKYISKMVKDDDKIQNADIISKTNIVIPDFKSDLENDDVATKLNSTSDIMAKVLDYGKETENVAHSYEQSSFLSNAYKILGVVFSTYIIVEQDESLYLIDQHAAHERFLFDKLIDEIQKGEIVTQQLLVPYKISVNAEEKDFILDNANSLQELGVEVQDFGLNSLIITQVPSLLVDIDLSSFITEILSDLQSFSRDKVVLRHKIATKACKSAVKAGDTLTNEEIEKLLDMVKESNSPLLCPHGRPYVVKITKSQVEKWFKRVL